MSNFSTYVLDVGAEVLLELDEATSTLVNDGSEGSNVTGTHTDPTYQRPAIAPYAGDYSMQYAGIGYTDASLSTAKTFKTMFFWVQPETLNDFLFKVSNSGVSDSTVSFYFSNGLLIVETVSVTRTTTLTITVGEKAFIGITYDDTNMYFYKNEEGLISTQKLSLVSTTFDTIQLSDFAPCYDTLVDESSNIFTDGTDPLETQAPCP